MIHSVRLVRRSLELGHIVLDVADPDETYCLCMCCDMFCFHATIFRRTAEVE